MTGNVMDRPVGMTWDAPNSMALVKGCKNPKPVYSDGNWQESFTTIRAWDGVYRKKLHWDAEDIKGLTEGCDTKIEWVLLDEGTTFKFWSDIFPFPKVKWFAAYNADYGMKVLTIEEDGTRAEFEIQGDINHWKKEMYKMVEGLDG